MNTSIYIFFCACEAMLCSFISLVPVFFYMKFYVQIIFYLMFIGLKVPKYICPIIPMGEGGKGH